MRPGNQLHSPHQRPHHHHQVEEHQLDKSFFDENFPGGPQSFNTDFSQLPDFSSAELNFGQNQFGRPNTGPNLGSNIGLLVDEPNFGPNVVNSHLGPGGRPSKGPHQKPIIGPLSRPNNGHGLSVGVEIGTQKGPAVHNIKQGRPKRNQHRLPPHLLLGSVTPNAELEGYDQQFDPLEKGPLLSELVHNPGNPRNRFRPPRGAVYGSQLIGQDFGALGQNYKPNRPPFQQRKPPRFRKPTGLGQFVSIRW